ncbi:MAG: type II secretion system major pseudopilin GspG [Treponema sp.]|nr:type II secretion system major pseudopilin GspG [Treponema sp.]
MKKERSNSKRSRYERKKSESRQSGFTFVETLAVLAIGAVLAAGASISVFKAVESAKEFSAKETVAQYQAALHAYYIDCRTYPSTEQGLSALWEKPVLVPVPESWKGPYVDKEIACDPWGNSFVYAQKGSAAFPNECPQSLPFAIISYGADGKAGGEGVNSDIVSWR